MIATDATPTPLPPEAQEGQVVGPAATATAAVERILAATQTAAAPTPQPVFQPDECPEPRGINAPAQPADFKSIPAAIGVYLSNGGAASVLESTLRSWGAINERGGVVQADTDLSGDGIPEIIVNIFNPFVYNPEAILNAGQLLIYGCDNFGYRLLYATPDNPSLALPVLHRVGDMNADTSAEVVFDVQSCAANYCTRDGSILSWNPVVGVFQQLNAEQIAAVDGRLNVVDVDGDGILELVVTSNPPANAASGPTRAVVDVWDWTGENYMLAVRTLDDPRYRVHLLQDADAELFAGNTRSALRIYFEVRNRRDLLSWSVPNEAELMRAFATYRVVTIYARNGDGRSEETLGTLLAENPEGSPGAVFAEMGRVFMETFRAGNDGRAACQAALGVAAGRPETLGFLNSYGYANRAYSLGDLCPF